MWHRDTLGLDADDHSQYALLLGRAGGQTLLGGTAAGQHLSLQSTSNAVRGSIKTLDSLQLVSPRVLSPGGALRIYLRDVSPHVTLRDDVELKEHASVGSGATPSLNHALRVADTLSTHPAVAGFFEVTGNRAGVPQFTYGLSGGAIAAGTPSAAFVYGLYFFAQHATPSPCFQLGGVYVQQQSAAAGVGVLSQARAFYASQGYWAGSKPIWSHGLDIENQGHATTTVAYGVQVDDQLGVAVRLLELGPANPYLRVAGGAAPPANTSHLHLRLGATLKQVSEDAIDTAGAGFRALRVPN